VQGYFNYYAVPGNIGSLSLFRGSVAWDLVAHLVSSESATLALETHAHAGWPMASTTAGAPSLSHSPLCRYSSKIRTGCA